jgi:ribonuclease VapC
MTAGAVVLDASAVLALLNNESGAQTVGGRLEGASISSVNWSEVVQKAVSLGVDRAPADMREDLGAVGLAVRDFSASQSEIAAGLWMSTREVSLSLADRACLALAIDLRVPVLTGVRAWRELAIGVEVILIR